MGQGEYGALFVKEPGKQATSEIVNVEMNVATVADKDLWERLNAEDVEDLAQRIECYEGV